MNEQFSGCFRNVQIVLKELLYRKQSFVIERIDRALFENFLQKCLAKRRRKIIDKPPDAEIVVRHDDLLNVKDLSDLDRNLRFLEGAGEVAQRIDDRSYTYHRAGVKLAVQSIHDRTGKFFEIA